MIEIQTVTVRLGERDYVIREAARIRSAPWRKRLMSEIKPVFDEVTSIKDVQFESPADLLKLWPTLERLLVPVLDSVFELLIAYSPELEADRAYIEQTATDKQIIAAFGEAVKLADPFGVVASMNLKLGRMAAMT